MKKTLLFSLVILTFSGALAMAGSVDFLAPDTGDLLPTAVIGDSGAKSLPNVSMDAVSYCWALKGDAQIDAHQPVFEASSREYRMLVKAEQLRSGLDLPTTAPGALIRLNPAGSARMGKTLSIDPKGIVLIDPTGRRFSDGQGMLSLADAEALKAADVPFAEGTSAFRLDPALGSGLFKLMVPEAADSEAGWVVNVLEKDSPVVFTARTDRQAYLQGQRLRASFALEGANGLESVRAEIHSPSGEAQRVRVLRRPGSTVFEVVAPLNRAELSEGLWEIHASVHGTSAEGEVIRDVHTAFAVSAPTASFLGRAEISMTEGLRIELPVEIGAPGRYAAQGVLFGTNAKGEMQPIGVCQSADYLATGSSSLSFVFDGAMLKSSGLTAPYELRNLELKDQGRMGELYTQARALVIQ